ncbi:site-specific DNA-methyltransferase [Eggerthellaceae bacterium zg-893]|nr:site-specific DNA-methyltransferase [Eggerthellaceae bacterium zg-893]
MAKIDVVERRDALRALTDLPDGIAGMLLTDPPYSSGGMFRGDRAMATSAKYQKHDAEKKPEFYGDSRDGRSFAMWSTLWMSECLRAMADGASAVVFSDWRQLANTTDAMQAAGFVFRGIIPWRKTNPRPQPNSFCCECEYAVWGTKGPIDRAPLAGSKYLHGAYRMAPPTGDERVHSAQKPLGLVKALMEIAGEGAIVLDPFMGSGTTAVAAIETGRHFIGYELSPEYCAIANDRAARAKASVGGLNG